MMVEEDAHDRISAHDIAKITLLFDSCNKKVIYFLKTSILGNKIRQELASNVGNYFM